MTRTVVLSGGGEFEPENEALDRAMLKLTGISYPTLVIVPAAAAAHARRTVKPGVRYFDALSTETAFTMVVDDSTAENAEKQLTLENTNAIYLTDGSPLDATNVLKGSSALRMIGRSWARGAILSACGAGAMALCAQYWEGGVWSPGLGLVQGIAILPHHQVVAGRFNYARLSQGLTPGTLVVGLDDHAGIILTERKATARVIGSGFVTVYSTGDEQDYEPGGTFDLPVTFI